MHDSSILTKKLVVQPVFVSLVHLNVFMGPCRYGYGEALSYEYEKKDSLKTLALFNNDISQFIDHSYVELLNTKYLEWHEDFAVKEETLKNVIENKDQVDVYLISGTRLISYVSTIIAKRTNKPLAFCPLSTSRYSRLGGIDASAHLFASGHYEVYNAFDYNELNQVFRILNTRKALRNTKILYGLRNNVLSFGCVSSFIDLSDITNRFGMEILNYNGLEFFKVMDGLTDDEIAKAKQIADDLVKNANGVHMPAENIVKDVKFYIAVNKVLAQFDCNAFTLPCFEMCATQELNKRELTFCLTHSLLKDEGIPSACAGDVGAIVAIAILMSLARKAPHMGNCMAIVDDVEHKAMRILHDVCSKYMKGYDREALPIDYVSFTKGNWGTTMRYDFGEDTGQEITMINLSPRMDKIMIAKGTITGCNDFLTPECKHAVTFTVKDSKDFHKKEADFGHHFAWVYGDYVEDLLALADVLGIESVIA
jgi:L-fucose isomerase-like protein